MCKKLGSVLLGLLVGAFVLYGTKFGSYVRTGVRQLTDEVGNQVVTPEMKIARLKTVAEDMDGAIQRKRSEVAKALVGVEDLEKEVAGLQDRLDREKKQLAKIVAQLDDQKTTIDYDGRNCSVREAKSQLSSDVKRIKTMEGTLASKREQEQAQREKAQSVKAQLDTLEQQRDQLKARIDQAEAKLESIKAAKNQTEAQSDTCSQQFDKELADLERQIRVLEKVQEMSRKDLTAVRTPAVDPNTDDALRDARNILDSKPDGGKPATK